MVNRESIVTATGLLLVSAMLVAQAPLEFDVVSVKRNATNTFASGPPPNAASGQFTMTNVPLQSVVLAGYPLQTIPAQVIGLPDWATADRYDVVAKGKPGATQDERQQMWRAFLADRLKLQVHYEMRERAGYNLVFARADKRLGPQLQPSTLNCTQLPAPNFDANTAESAEAMAMTRCNVMIIASPTGEGVYSGATTVATLIRTLSGRAGRLLVDRPIVDRTGLEGNYAVRLKFTSDSPPMSSTLGTPPPQDGPSIFTAIQEQLGLKLESMTFQGQVLVIDHIERPTEN